MLKSWTELINSFDMLKLEKMASHAKEVLRVSKNLHNKKLVLIAEDTAGELALEACHMWLSTCLVKLGVSVCLSNAKSTDRETIVVTVSGQNGIKLGVANRTESSTLMLHTSTPLDILAGLAQTHLELVMTLMFAGGAIAEQYTSTNILQELTSEINAALQEQKKQLSQLCVELELLATKWSNVAKIELIGDAADRATARLSGIAISRLSGRVTTVSDSENWCHVNFYGQPIREIGLLIFAQHSANNYDIIEKVISVAGRLGRPIAVVQDRKWQNENIADVVVQPHCTNVQASLHFLLQPIAGCILAELLAGNKAGCN